MTSRPQRHLDWEGCFNARDLGELRTPDGRETLWGRVVRADALDSLTVAGWAALSDHGVRTVTDLPRFPERSAAVLSAIARAEPGGVVFHCGGGRDRAGQVTLLLLGLSHPYRTGV